MHPVTEANTRLWFTDFPLNETVWAGPVMSFVLFFCITVNYAVKLIHEYMSKQSQFVSPVCV